MTRSDLLRDLIGIAGAALVVAGVALLSVPGALILAGLLMMGGAWLSARSG